MSGHSIQHHIDTIKSRWLAQQVPLRPGATASEIAEFEARHDLVLPEAVRMYFETMDGMDDNAADEDFVSFWPLMKVNTVPVLLSDFRGTPDYGGIEVNLPDAANYYVFADYSIMVFVVAVKLTAESSNAAPVIRIHNGTTWSEIAPSFEDFLRAYALDPLRTIFWQTPS